MQSIVLFSGFYGKRSFRRGRIVKGTRDREPDRWGTGRSTVAGYAEQYAVAYPEDWGGNLMQKKHSRVRTLLLAASGAALLCAMPAVAAAESEALPSRGRAAALLTALFYHDSPVGADARAALAASGRPSGSISSITPRQAMNAAERAKVFEFANSLVYEGGFFPKEIYQLLGIENATTARIARMTRQLDQASVRTPSPWEVAGRVGRSGMTGSSDHWAMAPGADGEYGLSTPGTLAYLPALAIVYAAYPGDGQEAAAQLAILKDDDMRAAPVARAALSLLMRVLVSDRHDKDAWLREAAADSMDTDTEHDLRSLRAKDWRYLRGEECAMGRLERAVYLWYKGDGFTEVMREGGNRLRSRESLAYLAALSAATYGIESLPKQVIAVGVNDRQLLELINDLHDLATSEAVLRVEPESE